MRAAALSLMFFACSTLAAQEPGKKAREVAKTAAPASSFHDILPANAGLVVTITSQKRLLQTVSTVLEEVRKQMPEDAPPGEPAQMAEMLLSQAVGASGPLEGLDSSQPLGFALGLDLQRYFFLPATDVEALKKGLAEGSFVEKGKYVVVTTATQYLTGKTPLRPAGKGDVVLSVRPNVWLNQFKPMIQSMLGGISAQIEQQQGQKGMAKVLQAEFGVFSKLVESTSQLDVAVSLDKGDINAALYAVPAKEGVVRDLFQVFQKTEPLETDSLAACLEKSGLMQYSGYIPPEALKLLLGLVPWSQLTDAPGDKGVELFKAAMEKFVALSDGRQAQTISFTGPPMSMAGSAVVGIKNAEEYRKAVRELFDEGALASLTESLAAVAPGVELSFQKDVIQVDKIPVDTLVERFVVPGQGPVEIAIQFLTTENMLLMVFAKDPKSPRALEGLLKNARGASKAATKPLAPAAEGPKRFAKGSISWTETIRLGLNQVAQQTAQPVPSSLSDSKLATRFELYAGRTSLMVSTHTSLAESLKLAAAMKKLAPQPQPIEPPNPAEPVEREPDADDK